MGSIAPLQILASPILVILDLSAVLTMILAHFNVVLVHPGWLVMDKCVGLNTALVILVLVIPEWLAPMPMELLLVELALKVSKAMGSIAEVLLC